jgi:hypothetical protein
MAIFGNLLSYTNRALAGNQGVYIWGILQPTREEIIEIERIVSNDYKEGLCGHENYLDRFQNITDLESTQRPFLPLNVGETEGRIADRIHKHYSKEAFHKTVLFNLAIGIPALYLGIENFNLHWICKSKKVRLRIDYPFLSIKVNTMGLRSLLFFSYPDFCCQLIPKTILPPLFNGRIVGLGRKRNVTQQEVITNIPMLNASVAHDTLVKEIIVSRIILKKYFRFTYCTIPIIGDLKKYEAATKFALEKMGGYTIAHCYDYITYVALSKGSYPLADVIDFDTNLAGVIYNPLRISPIQIPV